MHPPTQNLLAWESALFQLLLIQQLLTLGERRKASVTFISSQPDLHSFAWYIDGKPTECGGTTTLPSYRLW